MTNEIKQNLESLAELAGQSIDKQLIRIVEDLVPAAKEKFYMKESKFLEYYYSPSRPQSRELSDAAKVLAKGYEYLGDKESKDHWSKISDHYRPAFLGL